jgi:hypothetical protein
MSKTVTVSLGGTDYIVPMLNVGQLGRIQDLPTNMAGFGTLKIALERADPKVENFETIEATRIEIKKAIAGILHLSGFDAPTGNPAGK